MTSDGKALYYQGTQDPEPRGSYQVLLESDAAEFRFPQEAILALKELKKLEKSKSRLPLDEQEERREAQVTLMSRQPNKRLKDAALKELWRPLLVDSLRAACILMGISNYEKASKETLITNLVDCGAPLMSEGFLLKVDAFVRCAYDILYRDKANLDEGRFKWSVVCPTRVRRLPRCDDSEDDVRGGQDPPSDSLEGSEAISEHDALKQRIASLERQLATAISQHSSLPKEGREVPQERVPSQGGVQDALLESMRATNESLLALLKQNNATGTSTSLSWLSSLSPPDAE
jgi:hypothetical protein